MEFRTSRAEVNCARITMRVPSKVGAMVGVINALKTPSNGRRQTIRVRCVAATTAIFVTVDSFLILHTLIPVIYGEHVPVRGLIGLAGAIAYIGLRQAILMFIRIAETAAHK